MHSRILRSFLTVADAGSISMAAELLNISQPALTKSIQKLEGDIGTKLFTRIPKGVQLTKAGEILAHHARVMENEYRHATMRISELSGTDKGRLRVGAGPIWLVKILPPIIAKFQKRHPDIRVTLIGGVIDTLMPAVVSGDLDLICASLDFPDRSELLKIPLFEMNYIIVVDPSHPLAHYPSVTAKDLAQQQWLTLQSDYVGTQRLLAYFSSGGAEPPKISLETTSIHSLLETLRSGEYIAQIPEQMLELAQEKGLIELPFKGTLWQTSAGLAMRENATQSAALTDFIETVREATKVYAQT